MFVLLYKGTGDINDLSRSRAIGLQTLILKMLLIRTPLPMRITSKMISEYAAFAAYQPHTARLMWTMVL